MVSGSFDYLSQRMAEIRDRAERDLLAAILGNPVAGIAAVEEVGLTANVFLHQDLRVMFETCQRFSNVARTKVLSACESALRLQGHWDPSQCSSSESSLWSSASFRRFADRFSRIESPLCATEARLQARTLIRLFGAERDAEEYYRHVIKIMQDATSCYQPTK